MNFAERKTGGNTFKFIFCLFANFILFGVCYYCGLPIHLEHAGSLYATVAVGLVPGIVIAVISQLVYALFYFGFSNILLLIPILLVMFFAVFAERCNWFETVVASLGVMSLSSVVYSSLTVFISLLVGHNYLGKTCWIEIYDAVTNYMVYSNWKASWVTVAPYAVFNLFAMWIVAMVANRLTPKQAGIGFSDTFAKKRLQNRK